MAWTTKTLERVREYVVIKHRLQDINGTICGVKFRGGYAAVEKNSKAYKQLKQLPLIKGEQEFPLIYLRNLKFITRTSDIRTIFGQDVYYYYLKDLNEVLAKEAEEKQVKLEVIHTEENNNCAFRTQTGKLCKHNAVLNSPSKYCKKHILEDVKLIDVGIKVPERLTYKEQSEWKDKVVEKLEKLKI